MLGTITASRWLIFIASVFLVSIPVFIQAPLVRAWPLVSLAITFFWFGLGRLLQSRISTRSWGNLLIGFAWTWLAGSIYWGWFRFEPLLHLPIEAIGLPFALMGIIHQRNKIGNWFYLGSLFGTCMTDLYFYLVDLIPHWRRLMEVDVSLAGPIFQDAVFRMETLWGTGWALAIVMVLLLIGGLSLRSQQLHWRAFSGAVLSTVLVDGLFWIAASSA